MSTTEGRRQASVLREHPTGLGTERALVQGIRYFTDGATTESIVMRGSPGTVRVICGEHRADNLKQTHGEEP